MSEDRVITPESTPEPSRPLAENKPDGWFASAAGRTAEVWPADADARSPADSADTSPHSDSDDADSDDADFIPRAPWRPTALSLVLIALVLAGVGFISGVLTQKHHDRSLTSSATAGRAGAARNGFAGAFGGSGAGAGGFGGGEAAGSGGTGGTGGAGGSTAGSAGTSGGSATTQAVPVVIGTVNSFTATHADVTNLGGTKISVRLSTSTLVTAPLGTTALRTGATVSVYGTKSADGSVTATSITAAP